MMMSGSEFVVSTRGMPDAVMSQVVVTACVVTKVMVSGVMMSKVVMTELVVTQMSDAVPQAQKEHRQRHPQPDEEQQKVKVWQGQPVHCSSRQPSGCRRQLCRGRGNFVNRPRALGN